MFRSHVSRFCNACYSKLCEFKEKELFTCNAYFREKLQNPQSYFEVKSDCYNDILFRVSKLLTPSFFKSF